MASKFNFVKMRDNFIKLKRELPIVIGNDGQNFFRRSFEKQGFTDKSFEKWPEVERRRPGTPAYKYPKKNAADRHKRNILVGLRTKGGPHLRDSVNNSLKVATFEEITFAVPQVYAQAHNDGLQLPHFKMKQRKFIGHSEVFITGMLKKISAAMSQLRK